MNSENTEGASCPSGKQQHGTREQALAQLVSLKTGMRGGRGKNRNGGFDRRGGASLTQRGYRLNAYRCPECRFWHVGHTAY